MEATGPELGGGEARRFERPPVAAVDLDPAVRPGVPAERTPRPWPNARVPPARMRAEPAVPTHDRPGKTMPPVYGTAVPLRGLSGAVRRAGYRYPDHQARHWLLLLLGDRVDALGARWRRRARWALPLALVGLAAWRVGAARR